MKLPNGINPSHVASTDKTRYVMNGVCIRNGLAYATNGRALLATECKLEDEDAQREAIIPTRIAKKGFNTKPKDLVVPRIYLKEVEKPLNWPEDAPPPAFVELLDKDFDRTVAREIEGSFPKAEHVVPDLAPYTVKISFNLKLLTQIMKSLNSENVHLFATGEEKDPFIILSAKNEEDSFGILMPLHCDIDLSKNRPLRKMLNMKRSALEKELNKKSTP